MAGYTRTDTTNNIADGNIINATDLDNEFDGIQAAFNSSTGHNHDGTTGEGAPILVLGPTQDVVVGATTVTPKTTNTVDIGSSSLKFKDLFLAGNASIGGTLAVTGVATLTAQPILSSLTASRAVFTDGSKGLVSNAITGTGNVVMSAAPTLTGTITAEALTLSGATTLSGGTANGVAYLNSSKVLTTGSALTFDGTRFGVGGVATELFEAFGTGRFNGNLLARDTLQLQRSSSSLFLPVAAYTNGSGSVLSGTTRGDIVAIGNAGSDGVIFANGNTERARIDSSGNLLIGTTSALGKVGIVPATSQFGAVVNAPSSSGTYYFHAFQAAGTGIGSITSTNGTATLYNTTSDQRLKENIADAASASDLIDALQVRQFDWKTNGTHQRYGFVAQELTNVAPEAVYQPTDADEMMAVDYSKLVPMLVKEIQSLRARVAALEAA